jgi:hypothetical protein
MTELSLPTKKETLPGPTILKSFFQKACLNWQLVSFQHLFSTETGFCDLFACDFADSLEN